MRRVAALALVTAVLATTPTIAHIDAAVAELGLLAQQFEVGGSGTFEMTVQVPAGLRLSESTAIVVTAHRPIDSRDDIAAVLEGDLPRVADRVEVETSSLARVSNGGLIVSIPLELTTRRRDALRFEELGIHPLVVELVEDAEVLAEVITFVHRVAEGADGEEPLPIAFAVSVPGPVRLDDDGTAIVDDDAIDGYTRLADMVERSPVPLSVRVDPAVIETLATGRSSSKALVERLRAALVRHEVVSRPHWPLDPSAAAAADEQSRFARWLRAGEETLAARLGVPARRTVAAIDGSLTTGGAQLLGDLGARLVVLTTADFDSLPGPTTRDTDTSLIVPIAIGPESTLDAIVVDGLGERAFASPSAVTLVDAIRLVAGLVALRDGIVASGDTPARHAVLLATGDLALPDADSLDRIAQLVASSTALVPVTLEDVSIRTATIESSTIAANDDDTSRAAILERAALSRELVVRTDAAASMLPLDDERPDGWRRRVDIIVSSGLDDAQVDRITQSIERDLEEIRASVVLPAGFGFTLTGRRSEIPLKLTNNAATPLRVVVRLSSSKLLFPSGDTTVDIPAGDSIELQIPVETRSSGRFPVTLEVRTPVGDELIGAPVPLTATVTALSGLGNLVTGVLLLLLISWWIRHVGKRRAGQRRHAATEHPATAPDPHDRLP